MTSLPRNIKVATTDIRSYEISIYLYKYNCLCFYCMAYYCSCLLQLAGLPLADPIQVVILETTRSLEVFSISDKEIAVNYSQVKG